MNPLLTIASNIRDSKFLWPVSFSTERKKPEISVNGKDIEQANGWLGLHDVQYESLSTLYRRNFKLAIASA